MRSVTLDQYDELKKQHKKLKKLYLEAVEANIALTTRCEVLQLHYSDALEKIDRLETENRELRERIDDMLRAYREEGNL